MLPLLLMLASVVGSPDLIVTNANVITLNEQAPTAEALAVQGGRFTHVGSNAEVQALAGPNTKVIDLRGQTVVPGFIDAHCHPRPVYEEDSRWYDIEAGPEKIKTIDELIAAIQKKAKLTPKGMPITGNGYQETKFGRHPTRQDLDRGSIDHPVIIRHSSAHLSVCNTAALTLAKVTKETKDPKGGAFDRDSAGEATGLLKEGAAGIVRAALPKYEPSEAEKLDAYRNCLGQFLAAGITSIHVAGTSVDSARDLAKARETAPVRFYIMLQPADIEHAVELKKSMAADEWGVRYGAIKHFHGNSLSGQTAWLYEPYADRADYFGIEPGRSPAQLQSLISRIHAAGLQSCVHANGDREIDIVLDAYEAVLQQAPRADHRHRIEHCSIVNEKILKRIKALNLAVAPHSYIYEHGDKMEAFGAHRWNWMHPNRSLLEQGTIVAGNSDYPVSAALPMRRIHDLVNRTSAEGKQYGAKQCCTVEQALHCFTLGSATAEFAENQKGSIQTGKLADFVVLDRDPRKAEPMTLKDISVIRTVLGGQTVFTAK